MLLPVSALPGGTLAQAPRFIDWLARAGQRWWQVLPLGPPDEFGSPYASPSAFAAWPGLLADPHARVDEADREAFRAANAYWIDDWVAAAGPGALDDQVRFAREWAGVRAYAAARGVRIAGDVPFYVAGGSADVTAHPELFAGDVVAGVPPDDFSADGQWGNPPYLWMRCARRVTAGGWSGCAARRRCSTPCAWTTSVASRRGGPCRAGRPRRARASGAGGPGRR